MEVDRRQLPGNHLRERSRKFAILTHARSRVDVIKKYLADYDKKECTEFVQHMERYLQM